MSETVTICDQLQDIMEDICTYYCKYPEQYLSQYKDPDMASDKMLNERCENCPLEKIV